MDTPKVIHEEGYIFMETMFPEAMQSALIRYFEHRNGVGHFLTAVLENDLKGACSHADDTNQYLITKYVQFMYNYVPAGSWGSTENVSNWLNGREL